MAVFEHEIRGLHATVLETVLSTFAHVGAELNELAIMPTSYDIVGEADPKFADLLRHSRTLCEFLVSELLSGTHSTPLDDAESRALDTLNAAARHEGVRLNPALRAIATIPTNVMIHEIGLERFRTHY